MHDRVANVVIQIIYVFALTLYVFAKAASHMTVISDFASADKNSFGLVRLLAAVCVVVSHSYLIAQGVNGLQPLEALTGYTLGAHAVHVFFTVSGLLVAASFERRPSLMAFGAARFFRIYPGLLMSTTLVFLFFASFVSTSSWSEILAASGFSYFVKTLVMLAGSASIPGVFAAAPNPGEVNVPIWTLKYEVACYISLGLVMRAVLSTKRVTPLQACAAILLLSGAWMMRGVAYNDAGFFDHIARFSFAFWSGVAAWHSRDKIPIRYDALTALLALVVISVYFHLPVLPHFLIISTGYAALMFSRYRFGPASTFTNRNDMSYGTYILGWPVEQTILLYNPGMPPLVLALYTLIIVLPLAYLSWRYVEKPTLTIKDRFA